MGLFTPKPLDAFSEETTALADEYRILLTTESERLTRFKNYRDELTAVRTSKLNVQTNADYGRGANVSPSVRRHRFNLPFGQALTVKHSFRIAGRLPDAFVDRREESAQERHRSDVMEKQWWGITRLSNGDVQFADAAHYGSQLGASCIEVYWDIERQMPKYRAIDPAGVLVVKGVNDPHNFQRFYRFWNVPIASVIAEYKDSLIDGVSPRLSDIQPDALGQVLMVQMTDKQKTVRFALADASKGKDDRRDVPLYRRDHGYGFVNYVVIPNIGPNSDVWGYADYEFVREIIDYLNRLFGREADILRAVANGAMQLKGSKIAPRAAAEILAQGGILPVGREGSLDPVNVPDIPAFGEPHANRAIQYLEMLGFAPAAAWGDGAAGSGSDRGLQLGPMLELTSMKQINFAAGLHRLGAMCFKMIEQKQADNAKYTGTATRGLKTKPFNFTFGPTAPPVTETLNADTPDEVDVEHPMNAKELYDGEYDIRFSWPARLDPDDPAYVASELQKFTAGIQSAYTTLEKFGIEAPEDEMKLVEQENEKHPWLRQGMIKLIEAQTAATQQGANDGSQNTPDQSGVLAGASASMGTKDGRAMDASAMGRGLGGSGTIYGNN